MKTQKAQESENRRHLLCLLRSLLCLLCTFPQPLGKALAQTAAVQVDAVGQYVFIGQAYPSGNVYLRPFSGGSGAAAKTLWPEGVSLIPLGEARVNLPSVRRGTLDRVLASRTENDIVKSMYIPAVEGMDDSHAPCGLGQVSSPNPAHELISGDFFRAIFDHCEPNDGVAVYRTTRSNYSALTIGVADNISLLGHKVILDKRPRPLTLSEKQEVDRQKAEAAMKDCSTNPAYLDKAVQLFEATLKEGNLTLRVSTYETPGCAGHVTSIYVLDVLRAGELVKTFELSQYQGAL
jgi:hypothetical protein